jgi:hypothetical protein
LASQGQKVTPLNVPRFKSCSVDLKEVDCGEGICLPEGQKCPIGEIKLIEKNASGYETYTKVPFSDSQELAYINKAGTPVTSFTVQVETPCINPIYQAGPEANNNY